MTSCWRTSTKRSAGSDTAVPDPAEFPAPSRLPRIAELPDPFVRSDGSRASTRNEWRRQRAALLERVLHYQYGPLPPAPRNVIASAKRVRRIEPIAATETELILKMGPGHAVTARMVLTVPDRGRHGPLPVIVRGDLCWGRTRRRIVAAVVNRGYILADFDRTDIAEDGPAQNRIRDAYPGFDGGRIAAWAWGFHRVVDYLRTLDVVDAKRIAVTGHSRGGKAALLAGATDHRIALTAPNDSGCGGAGCYRLQAPGSEDIAAILKNFPYWFHPRFSQFIGKVTRLPFDQHTVKALVAPRALLTTEALGDLWANPKGTQQSHHAAKEVFAFLGVADRIGIHFRPGGHKHRIEDWIALLDFADWQFFGRNVFDRRPYTDAEAGYAWKKPGNRSR